LNDGIQGNYEICFKAYSRRAIAHKSLNQPEEALKDIDEALKLVEDLSAIKLKEQIMDQIKSGEMLSGIKQIEKQFDELPMVTKMMMLTISLIISKLKNSTRLLVKTLKQIRK
jgi:predicted DNA-binding protein YlxM (UPF0122 family)